MAGWRSIILKRACQKGWEGGQKWETEELTVENWWPSFNRNIKEQILGKRTDFGYDQINIVNMQPCYKRLHYQFWKSKIVSWTKISKIWRWKETAVQIIKGVLLQMTHISQNSCHPNTKESTYWSLLKENDRLLLYKCPQVLSHFCSIKYAFVLTFPSWCKSGDQIWAILPGGIILIWLYSTAEMIHFQNSTPEYWYSWM